jgi:hypothetical protein
MVSGHRASFPVSRATPCGGLASIARPAGPGNGVLPPSGRLQPRSRRQLFGSTLSLLSVTEVRPGGASCEHVVGGGPPGVLALRVPPEVAPGLSLVVALVAALGADRRCAARLTALPYAPIRARRGARPTASRYLRSPARARSGADGARNADSCATGPGLCPCQAAGRPVRKRSHAATADRM